ncbi:MAG: DUF309 domain-containing protein [Chloroflexi bacterium]|nr:DUF309 domain-containing protein [Chloroflexota bacterium]MCI0841701.1 DUF309 domain-containing protein [Chloroflexota bacterium]
MTRSRLFDLPRWPSKGTRRKLESTWLEELETHGMPDGLLLPPSQPPPQLFVGVEQFNRGLFWECHETLEEVWLETLYPVRFFYHAIIKVSVGFHHMNRHNRHGARAKLSDAVRLLPFFQPQFLRVRTDALLHDASTWLESMGDTDHIDWVALDALSKPIILMLD